MGTLTTAWADHFYQWWAPLPDYQPFLRLCTADPGGDGTLANEITGGGYTGQDVRSVMGAVVAGAGTNADPIYFTGMPAVTVTHWALCRSQAGLAADEVIHRGALAAPVGLALNETFAVQPGDLTMTIG